MRNYRKCKEKVQWVVVHHTDINDDYTDKTTLDILRREVERFNIIHGTKFESLYHYVALPSGRVQKFEDVGYYLPHGGLNYGEGKITNDNTVSVALSGKLSDVLPKNEILEAAANEVAWLIKSEKLKGFTYHNKVLAQIGWMTECPGLKFPFKKFEKMVAEKLNREIEKEEIIEDLPWWTEIKNWAVKNGILTGDEYGRIDMERNVTLAEVIAILYKYHKFLKGGG